MVQSSVAFSSGTADPQPTCCLIQCCQCILQFVIREEYLNQKTQHSALLVYYPHFQNVHVYMLYLFRRSKYTGPWIFLASVITWSWIRRHLDLGRVELWMTPPWYAKNPLCKFFRWFFVRSWVILLDADRFDLVYAVALKRLGNIFNGGYGRLSCAVFSTNILMIEWSISNAVTCSLLESPIAGFNDKNLCMHAAACVCLLREDSIRGVIKGDMDMFRLGPWIFVNANNTGAMISWGWHTRVF